MAPAQQPAEVKVGLIVPLSGIYTRPGQVMKMGAEMGIEHINAQGGIKSLGGAKMKLVVIDCGDTTEKAKNAAQRMVADAPNLVVATGAYLSSFTLAVTTSPKPARNPRSPPRGKMQASLRAPLLSATSRIVRIPIMILSPDS